MPKLTPEQISRIQGMRDEVTALAKEFGVAKSTVSKYRLNAGQSVTSRARVTYKRKTTEIQRAVAVALRTYLGFSLNKILDAVNLLPDCEPISRPTIQRLVQGKQYGAPTKTEGFVFIEFDGVLIIYNFSDGRIFADDLDERDNLIKTMASQYARPRDVPDDAMGIQRYYSGARITVGTESIKASDLLGHGHWKGGTENFYCKIHVYGRDVIYTEEPIDITLKTPLPEKISNIEVRREVPKKRERPSGISSDED